MVKQFYTLHTNEKTLPVREDKDVNAMIRRICDRGMKAKGFVGKPEYEARLEEELELILRKEFSVYFIILWDAIKWCRNNGILVGRGRGSAAGSLVCYLMEITDVDPLEYGLLFWRFLSDWRDELPDIDTDIADRDRMRLKKYLEDKYDADKVASVTTFIFFSAKSAIKGACRVLAVPYKESNDIVAGIEELDDFRKEQYYEFHNKYPGVYQLAKALDGRLQTVGFHAAATVITNMPITDLTSVESRKLEGTDLRQPVISLPKEDAEDLGFVKYDFLGLKTLSVVADACEHIKRNHNRLINLRDMKFDDPKVLKMISDGHTVGVFQAEASASTKVIKDMGVDTFADLVASNALVRPGAWKVMGEDYIAKKRGEKKVTYLEGTREFLEETYGEVLYQEQMLLLCTEFAGLTKEEADKIRKLTSKKKGKEELAPFKEKFIKGCLEKTTQAKAEKLWKDIETTAEYQFNKCLAEDTVVTVKCLRESGWSGEHEVTVGELYEMMYSDPIYRDNIFYVLGPDHVKHREAGGEQWYKIVGVHDNDVKDIYRIWIDESWYIDSTDTHRHRLSKGWKEAYLIHQNDVIMTHAGRQKVWKRTFEGQAQTFDIELAEEPHAFYANGIITHNSHSVAYSQLSYITAFLKYYYPAEFMAALLNNEKDTSSISDYLSECARLEIPVRTPDVHKSGIGYEVKDGEIWMGLGNVKYVSEKLASRLLHMRDSDPLPENETENQKKARPCKCIKHGPFESYTDFSDRIMAQGSGLNSRVIEAMNKVGASRFWDHPIDENECKKNYYEYLGIVSLDGDGLTPLMRRRLTSFEDYVDRSDAIVSGICKDIVSKNNWIRVDLNDGTGTKGFFVGPDHGLEKGKRYILALASGKIVAKLDMDEENHPQHPVLRYLRGDLDDAVYFVYAKAGKTKNGNDRADLLYSAKGKLGSCSVYSDMLPVARRIKPGSKVIIGVEDTKYGPVLKVFEREYDE